MFRPGGAIATIAGTGFGSTAAIADGSPARSVNLDGSVISGSVMAVGPEGGIYIAQADANTVRRIAPIAAALVPGGLGVPSPDGAEVYVFDLHGRHLRTLDGLTAALRNEFTYDAAGQLAAITDGDGNVTTVERDGAGDPTAVVGPFGQRTALAANADGFLERVTSPTGEVMQFAYTTDGLLTEMTNPRGHTSHYGFGALGRLTSAMDPTGAIKTLVRSGTNRDHTVVLTSALGRATTYRVERPVTGDFKLTNIDPAGAQTEVLLGRNRSETVVYSEGTRIVRQLRPDPRWGMWAPVVTSMTVQTPGGRLYTHTGQRTATLTDPTNLLSLRTLTETATVNGRVFTRSYDATTRTITDTSPAGRRGTTVIDARGWPKGAGPATFLIEIFISEPGPDPNDPCVIEGDEPGCIR